MVQDELATLYGAVEDGAVSIALPEFVRKELEGYLDCGHLCRGFARLRCEGCTETRLVGTHHAGLVRPIGGVVPIATALAADAETRAVALPAKAGEVILIHNHMWHRSRRSTSGQARRALTVCYLPAATRCTRTKRAPREFARVFG